MKSLLHIGCGPKSKLQTTRGFATSEWTEIRLDIDSTVSPDVVSSFISMPMIPDASVDAIFSSHNIEHLYPHEVPVALKELLRVLADDGIFVVTCPDIRAACALIADDKLLEPAYVSPAGPIAPMDMLFGFRGSLARGNLFMAHHCGFTQRVLIDCLREAGFQTIASRARPAPFFDLWAIASKSQRSEAAMREMATLHFP